MRSAPPVGWRPDLVALGVAALLATLVPAGAALAQSAGSGVSGAPALQGPALALTLSHRLAGLPVRSPEAVVGRSPPADTGLERTARCADLSLAPLTGLRLADVLDHVICRNPQLTQALLLVTERQAGVAEADSAFRPRFYASAEYAANRIPSGNSDAGSLGSSLTGSVGLTWTLLDFGVRQANARQSRLSLDAATANRQSEALNAVNEGMRLFVEAATAQSQLEAAREAEAIAQRSLEVVQAKYEAQVAGLSDKLQIETVLAQARLDRIRAEGGWDTARGLLAVSMGLRASETLGLAPPQTAFPGVPMPMASGDWVADATASHPRVRSAAAEVQALQARMASVQAAGKGSVELSLGVASTRDLAGAGGRFEHNVSGAVVASVPLFNGREQQAREAQAQAQIGARESVLTQVQREVESELWRNLKLVQSEVAGQDATAALLAAAAKSYEISFGRYKSGVGSIQELLVTQTALASASAQMTQARLSRAHAQLKLAVASGRLVINR